MKSSQKINIITIPADKNLGAKTKKELLQRQSDNCKQERDIFLDLSDSIIRVRDKNDLIKVLASKLRSLFYFTQAVISLIDKKNKTCYPFLYDV